MADVTNTFYPAADAIHGYGAQWLISDGSSPGNFQAVAAVVSITPGDMKTEVIDRTHLRSPDAHREKMAGIRDSGPFTMNVIWLPLDESQSNAGGGSGAFDDGGIVALWRNRTERDMQIILNNVPAGSPDEQLVWPFRGIITKFQPGEIGIADKINAMVEVTPLQAFDSDLP